MNALTCILSVIAGTDNGNFRLYTGQGPVTYLGKETLPCLTRTQYPAESS